jgi:hypothetical protein
MSQATQTHTTPTRRCALGFSAAAIVAGITTSALVEARHEIEDPVIVLYRRYRGLGDAGLHIDERTGPLRAGLVERWGEIGRHQSADQLWEHDPASTELSRLNDESDQITDALTDVTNEIMETPATTLAGLRCKMQIGLDLWPTGGRKEDREYHEDAAFAFMKDALRLLSISASMEHLAMRISGADASIPMLANAAESNPDAELIRLCDRMIAVRAEQEALAIADPWAPDDGPLSEQYHELHDEWIALADRLQVAEPPTTLEGIRAAARMAWNGAGQDRQGRVMSSTPWDWIRLQTIGWAAGVSEAPLLPQSWLGERVLDKEIVA